MAVKTLSSLLDRLKISLRNDACCVCHKAPCSPPQQTLCFACEKRLLLRQPIPLMNLTSGTLYAACEFPYAMKRMIYGLKFQNKTNQGFLLSEILMHYWQQLNVEKQQPWIVVPIPPHQDSGIDHVCLFSRPFASHFGYDFVSDGLLWTRPVAAQHTILNKRRRRENITGALQVSPKLAQQILKSRRPVLVMDDIMTTGSTLVEALSAFHALNPTQPPTALAASHVPLAITRF